MRRTLLAIALSSLVAWLVQAVPARAITTPNDFYFEHCSDPKCVDEQWNLMSDGRGISADTAWDTTKGAGTVIAVIDSGIDFSHEDLVHQIWTNPGEIPGNGIDDDGNGYIDDWRGWDFYEQDNDPTDDAAYGHGTSTSAVAVAEQNNTVGISGVAPEAKLMVLRDSDTYLAAPSRLAEAIYYAADNGANVISMSLGSIGTSALLKKAVAYAESRRVIMVAATANEFSEHPNSPTWLDPVIGVGAIVPDTTGVPGAVTANDFTVKASYSNYGPGLDVVAPSEVYTANYGGGYGKGSGTSNATPHVAGVGALVIARAKVLGLTLSSQEVTQIIRRSADDLVGGVYGYGTGWDRYTGWGRVDAAAAVNMVSSTTIPPVADIDSPDWYGYVAGAVNVNGSVSARSVPYNWTLSYGAGDQPASFTQLATGSGSTAFKGKLGTFDPGALGVADGQYTLDLVITDGSGHVGEDRQAFSVLRDSSLLSGFPKLLTASVESAPQFANLDGRPGDELIVADQSGFVHAYLANGRELRGWPVKQLTTPSPIGAIRPGFVGSPAVADLNGDSKLDVVIGGLDGDVYAWDARGRSLTGWPVPTKVPPGPDPNNPYWESAIVSSPAVGELDAGHAGPEVVVGDGDGKVYAFHSDGTTVAGWPVLLDDPSQPGVQTAKIASSPALGDIDGDGANEVVIGSGESFGSTARVYALRADGTYQPGWPVTIPAVLTDVVPVVGQGTPGSPVLTDVNGDGALEVGVASVTSRFHLLNGDGTEYAGGDPTNGYFSNVLGPGTDTGGIGARATVGDFSFADIDRDGKADFISVSTDGRFFGAYVFVGQIRPFDHLLSAWHTSDGSYFYDYPRVVEDWMFQTAPIAADVDGDGVPEIVIGNGDGWLHAKKSDGTEPAGWPKYIGQWLQASVAAGDMDADGGTDIAVATRQGYLFVFETSGLSSGLDWPNLRGTPANTGVFTLP